MALPIRRRRLWLLGLFALLVILTYGLARLMDEPLRRYMEYRVNQCLTGYTVRMRNLHVHPWTVSLDLENATILQDANPDPPVANITKLTVSVELAGPMAILHALLALLSRSLGNIMSALFRSEEHTSELQSRRDLVCRL